MVSLGGQRSAKACPAVIARQFFFHTYIINYKGRLKGGDVK